MRNMVLMVACALLGTGCLDSIIPGHQAASTAAEMDMAQPTGNGGGGGGSTGTGTGGDPDGGATTASGVKQFGDLCTTDGAAGDCASAMCKQFAGGTVMRCTKACTYVDQTTPAPECPNPPSAGLCTTNSYCKFTQ
jgi:hypothetical protein